MCQEFDKNRDGTIDKAEMKAVFDELNRNLSDYVRTEATLTRY